MSVVVDCSVFLAWSLADEDEPVATEAMRRVVSAGGVAPAIWWHELRNALLMNERRGRLTAQHVAETLADCAALGIETDGRHDESLVLGLAREHALSVYDASCLEVASRRRLPLATLERKLSEAAVAAGVPTIDRPG